MKETTKSNVIRNWIAYGTKAWWPNHPKAKFTKDHFHTTHYVLVSKRKIEVDSLKKLRLGTIRGFSFPPLVTEKIDLKKLSYLNSLESSLKSLDYDRIDAFLYNSANIDYINKSHKYEILHFEGKPTKIGLVYGNTTSEIEGLINTRLSQMIKNGKIKEILDRYYK